MKKTQKVLLISGIFVVALFGLGIASFKIMENSNDYEKAQLEIEAREPKNKLKEKERMLKSQPKGKRKLKRRNLKRKQRYMMGLNLKQDLMKTQPKRKSWTSCIK